MKLSEPTLSVDSFALRVGVHRNTVRRWCMSGRLPDCRQTGGGQWRIPAGHLERYKSGLLPLPRLGERWGQVA